MMRKIRLFKYSFAPPHLHDAIPEYRNSVPFSEDGIAKWCELVDSKDAELFYCGQWDNRRRAETWPVGQAYYSPEIFEFYDGNESKHVIDFEGDWAGPFPEWSMPCVITAMNAQPEHMNWNVMVRGGCSMLLMDMVKNPRPYRTPKHKGFCFRGQLDPHGLRIKVLEALRVSGCVGTWQWNDRWNAPTPVDDPMVRDYEHELADFAFALCPGGTGKGMTCRFFEACGMGRIPVVIADNMLFGDNWTNVEIPWARQTSEASIEILARWLQHIEKADERETDKWCQTAYQFFNRTIKPYFDDPTLYFLNWAQARGLIEPL